jgi:hypothetical protein
MKPGDIHKPASAANPPVNTLATIALGQVNSLVSPDGARCKTADDLLLIGLFTVSGLDRHRALATGSQHWTNS